MTVTFATPYENGSCEHDLIYMGMDMKDILFKCRYCNKKETEPRIRSMNC